MTEEFKPLIKNSKFVLIWTSQILSQLTINIVTFLLITTLFNQTGSAIATSLLWISFALPAIVLGPFAAATVDMVDRRKLLMFTNLLQALTIFGFAFLKSENFFLPYGVVMIYSLLNQFYLPAESASIPSVVSKKLLPLANGLFFITQQSALVLGFGIAGILNHFLGYQNSLFLCAAFLFIAFLSVSFLPKLGVEDKFPRNLEDAVSKFFTRIVDGYYFIKENNKILVPFLLLVVLQVAGSILAVNIPAFATEILKININSAGVLIVVPGGLGALFGAFVFPKLLKKGLRKRKLIENSLLAVSLIFLFLALLIPQTGNELRLILAGIAIFIAGLSFVGIVIPSQTFLQEATPGGLRGRVFGNFWFIVTIVTLLPVLFSGAITEILGISILLSILSFAGLGALVFARKYAYRLVQKPLNGQSV